MLFTKIKYVIRLLKGKQIQRKADSCEGEIKFLWKDKNYQTKRRNPFWEIRSVILKRKVERLWNEK